MQDVIVGLLALVVGALFCFRGYLALRLVIPIWGAFAGFVFGAGLVDSITGDGFLGTALGWGVGFAVAIVFSLIAYLYYEIAVIIGMSAIGFTLGTAVMVAIGVTWSWVIILVGVVVAVALALLAIIADLPMMLLTLLTATAGATTMVTGMMLLAGTLSTEDFEVSATTETLDDSWWWYAIYAVLVLIGIIAQVRDQERLRQTLRQNWETSGGRTMRSSV
jgi:hypothetical protein